MYLESRIEQEQETAASLSMPDLRISLE